MCAWKAGDEKMKSCFYYIKDEIGKKLRFHPIVHILKMRGDRTRCKKYLWERTWAVDQEPGDPWLILPLFPTFASSKGDTVILNTITKAEPGQRCNHTCPERRNEDVNSGCCICTFIYRPLSILSVFWQREGCVCKTGWVTGLTYQAGVIGNFFLCITVQRQGKYCILRSGLLTLSTSVCKCV